MRFSPFYALAALVVFVTEICIALYVHDAVIRPYIGDSLAVILVYLTLRAVTPMSVLQALAGALVLPSPSNSARCSI